MGDVAVAAMHQWRMLFSSLVLLGLFVVSNVGAFSTSAPSPSRRSTLTRLSEGFADTLFDTISSSLPSIGKNKQEEQTIVPLPPPPFQPTPEGVIQRAKLLLACDLGVQDESLLDPNFIWIGPNLGSKVLSKTDYLAAGKFFDLRSTFPDLDYRAHDFRIDENDPMTIRVTARAVGTMRGELRLRNEVLPPNGKQMQCPPEAISMTFDKRTGRLVKLCSGFTMDRLVGNTGGLCGVMGAATVAGKPPSDWEVYPATQVVKRFFGRPAQPVTEASSFLAPFPETVMVQLAKGIFSANMAEADPDLLSPSFQYYGPYDGPVDKSRYLEKFAALIFDGLSPELSHFRVDPYDPYRVWVDVKPSGMTNSGVFVDGPPQAFSFTFDDEGFCTRITACAVMDPSIGNTGGLTGVEGEKYAAGNPSPGIAARPLPQALGRLKKRITSPFTKVSVDEYKLTEGAPVPVRPSIAAASIQSPVEELKQPIPKPPATKPTPPEKVEPKEPAAKRPTLQIPKISLPSIPKPDTSDDGAANKNAEKAAAERQRAQEEMARARAEKLEAQKQKDAQIAAEKEEAAIRREEARIQALEAQKQKAEQMAAEREEAARKREEEIEAEKERNAAAQAEMAKRKAQAEASRIARAAAIEAEKTRKVQLAAQAARKKAEDQARAIESRRQATEAEIKRKEQAQALEAEARRKAEAAQEQAGALKRKLEEAKRQAEDQAARKKQEKIAARQEELKRRREQEAEALRQKREAQMEAERQRKDQIAAQQKAEADAAKREREAAAAAAAREKKEAAKREREAAVEAAKREQEAAAEAAREKKAAIAAERQAAKEREERKAEVAKQERKRNAEAAAELQAQKLRKSQEERAAKRAQAAARSRPAQVKAERPSLTSAPKARPTISLFGLGSPAELAPPKATPVEAPAPRRTISLASIFGGSSNTEDDTTVPSDKGVSTPRKVSSAPRGVPTISSWNQNRDGSITGRISGSPSFREGEEVTTSPIGGKATGGALVRTSSGSRYYLEITSKSAPAKKRTAQSAPAQSPRPSISLFGLGGDSPAEPSRPSKSGPKPRPSKPIPNKVTPAQAPRPSISLFGLGGDGAAESSRPSKSIPKRRPSKPIPKKVAPAPAPRPSISLFGLGGDGAAESSRPSKSVPPKPRPSKPIPKKVAPAPAPRPSISLFGLGGVGVVEPSRPSKSLPKPRPSKSIPKKVAPAPAPRPSISLFGLGNDAPTEKSRPSKSVPKPRPPKKAPPAPAQAPRSTISLFGFGGGRGAFASKSVPVPKAPTKKAAPRGVPTLIQWTKNRDGSITGRITGSSQFDKNEKVTTSSIASGAITSGSVVTTKSGSRYFLA